MCCIDSCPQNSFKIQKFHKDENKRILIILVDRIKPLQDIPEMKHIAGIHAPKPVGPRTKRCMDPWKIG